MLGPHKTRVCLSHVQRCVCHAPGQAVLPSPLRVFAKAAIRGCRAPPCSSRPTHPSWSTTRASWAFHGRAVATHRPERWCRVCVRGEPSCAPNSAQVGAAQGDRGKAGRRCFARSTAKGHTGLDLGVSTPERNAQGRARRERWRKPLPDTKNTATRVCQPRCRGATDAPPGAALGRQRCVRPPLSVAGGPRCHCPAALWRLATGAQTPTACVTLRRLAAVPAAVGPPRHGACSIVPAAVQRVTLPRWRTTHFRRLRPLNAT